MKVLLIEKDTGHCWVIDTSSAANVGHNTEVWRVLEFATETEINAYIEENNLILQEEA